jgi:hypothetical protein
MAKLHEEVVVIKVSKLIKDTDTINPVLLTNITLESLEAVVQELIGAGALIEVTVA